MQKTITIPLPQNVTEQEKFLFEPYLTFKSAPLKIKHLKNAFVTYTGFCMDKNGLVKESHHDYPHQHQVFLKEASTYYYDVTDNPENLVYLNDNTYLLIHHPWFMYFHWISESIFRLWMVKDKIQNMILLLPDYYGETDFVMESLLPFGIKNIFFIPKGKSLYIKTLCMPQIKPVMESYDFEKLKEVRDFYLTYVLNERGIDINKGERIYISRQKASRRKVENEEDILPILLKYNFAIINNEDFSFLDQISIYSNAKYLISIHGSGLTNMLFMKPGGLIMEFHKKQTNTADWHSLIFWYMAGVLGHKYYHQICEPTNPADDFFTADFIVDLELLDRNLELMFS